MSDIHKIMEDLQVLEDVAVKVKDILADGHISVWELPKLVPLLNQVAALAKDPAELIAEIKKLDVDAGIQISQKLLEIVLKVLGAFAGAAKV